MILRREFVFTPVNWLLTVVLALLGTTAAIAGSGIEAGPEIWIDGPGAVQPGSPSSPDVAVDEMGQRIHVWDAFGAVNRQDIFLRRFDPEGNPLEDPRLVNTTTDDDQSAPRIAVSADGSFLVIFQSDEVAPGGVNPKDVVRSQAYDAGGNPVGVGTDQLLSAAPYPDRLDLKPDVAALRSSDGSAGGYVVVWASLDSSGTDTSWGLEACVVSSTGVPSPQFQVPSDPDGTQDNPSVTELADGGFLVIWTEGSQIWGRRFNSAGGPVGNDFLISTSFVAQKLSTDAAIGWDGRVIVVWADQEDNGGTNAREIYARLFDPDLNPLGPDFRVNTVLTDDQTDPRVADYGPKGFLVVWESQVASGDDPGTAIEARVVTGFNQFDGDGDGVDDPQMQLNVWVESGQQAPGAHGWYGRTAADWDTGTWSSDNSSNIIGRDLEHCMFCDDFEWFHPGSPGSLWRWTSSVGLVP